MKPEAHLPSADYAQQHPMLASPGESRLMQHMPQLDGVRALAVLMVIWWHFMPTSAKVGSVAPWGAMGVGLFFTLSGFLITRILLNCKLKIESQQSTVGKMMKQFYVRRFLRIFPLYYAVLLLLVIFNPTDVRSRIWWHIGYFSNIRFSYWPKAGEIERHLWSLSVEEQFYLIWPILIFLTPRRILGPLILAMVVCGPLWRIFTYTPRQLGHEWMMPGCLDLLGSGAFLAYLSLPQFGWSKLWNGLVELAGLIGVPLFIIFVTAKSLGVMGTKGGLETISYFGIQQSVIAGKTGWLSLGFDSIAVGGITYPIVALFAFWLIGMSSRGFRGPIGYILSSPPLVYIGRISYGLYVIHMFVPHLVAYFFPSWKWEETRNWTQFFGFTFFSIAIASLSWYCFEAPLNRLKKYFEYDLKKS